jgi:hypothetical protein
MRDSGAVLSVVADLWKAEAEGTAGLLRRRDERLASLVAHARVYSPYFREAYSGLGFGPVTLTELPVTHKPELMERFDDWVTDRRIRRDDLEAFIGDPSLSGVPFLDDYFVCRSSGTTAIRGSSWRTRLRYLPPSLAMPLSGTGCCAAPSGAG